MSKTNLQYCKKARQRTKNRILSIAVTSVLYGWMNNYLRLVSILNTAWQLSKYKLNDEQARNDFTAWLSCKLQRI